jgi:hypothetical protein
MNSRCPKVPEGYRSEIEQVVLSYYPVRWLMVAYLQVADRRLPAVCFGLLPWPLMCLVSPGQESVEPSSEMALSSSEVGSRQKSAGA